VFGAGVLVIVLGAIGLGVGLLVVESLTSDLRASLVVSRSAVETIADTVDIAAELAEGTTDAMRSASQAAWRAGGATRDAATGIYGVSSFLQNDLPEDIEAIRRAMPGAIGAADAVDSTLGALAFIGLDYSPEEPFGESLRRIQTALDELPDEMRAQSEALELLAPAAEEVAGDVEGLAADLDELSSTLVEVDGLAESYSTTVMQAREAVAETELSLDRTVLFLRVTLVLAAVGAAVVGYALITIDRALPVASGGALVGSATKRVTSQHEEDDPVAGPRMGHGRGRRMGSSQGDESRLVEGQ
jgi:methyl-accepting chemotaxis protein